MGMNMNSNINKENTVQEYTRLSKAKLREKCVDLGTTLRLTQKELERAGSEINSLSTRCASVSKAIDFERDNNKRLYRKNHELAVELAKRDGWSWWLEEGSLLVYDSDGTLVDCVEGAGEKLNADGITRVVSALYEKAQACHG